MKMPLEFLKRLGARDKPRSTPAVAPAPLLMALEPRIVYDASVAAVGVAQHHAEVGAHVAGARPALAHANEVAAAVANDASAEAHANASVRNFAQAGRDAGSGSQARQVVFVDPSVANYQQLMAGLPQGTAVVVLNSNGDGLAQMAQYLQQHPGVDSIHLVSHGENGAIQVGATWLTQGDFSAYRSELAQIGAAMKPGGDFLVYGCDVAEHADGKALVQQIAAVSHLNVAASADATGTATLGGDWTLEYDVGAVHTPVVFSKAAEQQYGALLGVTDETYDGQIGYDTPGGASGVTSFTLDGIIYTTDQPTEFAVDSTTVNQFGPPPLSTGPGDGVLFGNVQGSSLTSLTMSLQNGDKMAVRSFDIDINAPSVVAVEALDGSGNVVGTVTLDTSQNGGSSVFHVDLSANPAFSGIKSLKFVETDSGFLTPTLNNFTYVDLSSPPALIATSGTTAFVEADNTASTPVVVDSGITLTDGDATTAKQASVYISGNFASGQDILAFTNTSAALYGDISAGYNAATGIMTLTSASGTTTIAQWQNAFRAVTYTDTAITPNTSTRTVSFTLTNDAYNSSSNTVSKNVTVTATDQSPIVSTTGGTATYRAGSAATTIDSGVGVSDLDNTTQSAATVSVGTGFHGGDSLGFTNTSAALFGNIAGSYNSATGVMTMTSSGATATDAQWANALSAVTFSSTSTTYGNRTISFATNDGTKTSVAATDTVNVTSPVQIVTDSGSASFVAGDNTASTPVAVDAGLTVSDTAASTLGAATVAITGGFQSGEDMLSFTNDGSTMGNIVASYNATTGVMTLTSSGATATLAQWQSALESVKYTDTAVTPNSATRTVSFTVVDGVSNTSNTATRTVTVTDTDQTPIVTTTGGTTGYVGASSAVTIDGGISVSDSDNTTQVSGTATVAAGFHSGDTLNFTNVSSALFGNITASYNAATGVMTLTSAGATATDAQWANALSAVTFSSTSTIYGNRTISFATSDGTKTSAVATDTVHMTAPPTLTADSGSASFVAGDNTASTPVAIDAGLTVTDGSATTLASTTVTITGNFHSGEDVLLFSNDGATMGNIAASYNAATGVMTLTSSGATATLAQWQSALESVKYTDTAITPNSATRTISFMSVDSASNTSNTATRTVTVTDTDQTPIVRTTGGTTDYVGGTSAVTIDSGIAVSDLDNTTQSSATVSIGAGFHSGDTLSYVNTNSTTFGNIVGAYNAATGVLTLTSSGASATDAQWANALSAVTFSASSAATPGNRTISFATSDGTKTSAAATDTVSVLGPPTITTDSGSASFVAGDNMASTPVAIDAGLTVTDGSASTLASTTVAITGNFHSGEDVLLFTNDGATMGNIAASYNAATGVMTLTSSGATATLAQWQSALESVKYTDTTITPNSATRTISFTSVDSAGTTSNTATRTVTVTDTDQTPIVTTTGSITNYVAGASAATVDAGVSVSDLDNTTQSVGTVSITTGFHSGDTLTFVNTSSTTFGNIVGSYNAATGVLTLTSSGATASDAQWAHALSAVTYSGGSSATPGNRTISFATSDGTKTSAAATDTVSVLGPPTITTDSGSTSFVAGDNTVSTPVAIDAGLTVTDPSSPTLASATVAITGNFRSGEDVLAFINTNSTAFGNIGASYDAATGVLTLTSAGSTATTAQWQAALDAVTYTDTAITPNNATRTISFNVTDGNGNASNTATRTVTVADTDQTPIVATSGGSASFVAGDNAVSTPVVIDGGLVASDRDNTTLASATVAIIGNFHSGEDVLAFTNDGATMGNITASYDAATGVLTFTSSGATATLAQWQAALRSVTYTDTAVTPDSATRTIGFVVNDGVKGSVVQTRSVTVADTDQTPIVTTSPGNASFLAADNTVSAPVVIDGGIALSDRDNTTLASATVAITGNFRSGEDVLAFTNDGATMGNITASYNATTGVCTLTSSGATATLAQWQAALDAVTYTDTAVTPNNATRTIGFSVNDGVNSSAVATRTVTVADTDQTPIVATSGGSTQFVAGNNTVSKPVAIDSGLTLSDRDNTMLASATVAIIGHFHGGEDLLAFTNDGATMGNITASYDASTGMMTLSSSGATATVAQWQAALRSITYTDTAVTPDSATRTISFTINDGAKTSATATRAVTVTDVDQTPIVTTSSGSVVFGGIGHAAPVRIDPGITVADRDNPTLSSATVSIVTGFHRGEDRLLFVNDSVTMGNIVGSYDVSTGVLSLTSAGGTATLAQWQAALASVAYTDTSLTAVAGNRTIAFVVNDGTVDSVEATRSITVNAGFKGSIFLRSRPSTSSTTSTTATTGMVSASDPVVLNALVVEPALGEPPLPFHIATFAVPGSQGDNRYNVLDETQVSAQPVSLAESIAAPFNLPVTTQRETVAPAGAFTLALTPWVGANARIVGVTQADGRALPNWVHFDAATGQLHGHVPAHGHGSHELRLLLAARDQQGHQLYREVIVDFGKGHATHAKLHGTAPHTPVPAAAKPSLREQFERERQSFHVARPVASAPAVRSSTSATHT